MTSSELIFLAPDTANNNSDYLRAIVNKYLYHWPLFLLGILVCPVAGLLYLKKINPVYTVNAVVIIKDEMKEPDKKNNLQEIYLSNSPKLVENEIEVLGSRNLISQVVSNLQLWVTYSGARESKKVDLYKASPVIFKLLDSANSIDKKVITIIIKDKNSFILKNTDGIPQEFLYKEIIKSDFGTWQLTPTELVQKFRGEEIVIHINSQNRISEEYQKNIKIDLPNKLASTISLTLKDEVEQRGKDILNDLINNYNETSVTEKNRTTKKTLDFIDNRISSLTTELNNSEKNIEGYRSSRGITDISSQSQIYLENVQANDSKLNEVNVQLNVIDGIDKYLNSEQNTQNVPSTLGIIDPTLNSSIIRLTQLQLERQKLLATTPETNPDFESLDRQIKTIKHSIRENIENIKSSLLLTKDKLQSFNSTYESSIKNVPIQERQLVDKKRQQGIKETLYVYLLQKREEVALNYSSILSDAQIVDYAYSNTQTSRKPFVLGIAFLLGLLLPAGFIYCRTSLKNRVITEKQITEETGMPIFAGLSYEKTSLPLIIPDVSNTVLSEDFRNLRTSLTQISDKTKNSWVTLVTSSISKEGKSFISTNLGCFLAASGKKTIILEMDWKEPKITNIFSLPKDADGITNFLENQIPIEKIVQNSRIQSKLDIIGCGPKAASLSDQLDSEKLESLITWLRLNYDHIIIDTPPLNLIADAKTLVKFSNTALYIIRQGFTPKPLLKFIKILGNQEQFKNIKVIFNGIEKGKYGEAFNYGNRYYRTLKGEKRNSLNSIIESLLKRF